MKNIIRGVLAATLFATSALASEPAPKPATPPVLSDADPALWVLKDKDTTIYLFGTVHILKPGLSWFDEEVKAAFDRSDEVTTELILGDPSEMQAKAGALGVNPTGPGLSEKLGEKDRAAYVAALKELGIPAQAFERFDPWMAAMVLSILPLVKKGYDPNAGVESVIDAAAVGAKKKRTAFETIDEQLGFFESLSPQSQIAYLNAVVAEIGQVEPQVAAMITSWSAGKPEDLAKLMNRSTSMSPELHKLLLTDRNARWAERLDARMDQPGTVFVAVGAGHLAGKGSVQEMLKKRGFKVKRVKY